MVYCNMGNKGIEDLKKRVEELETLKRGIRW
jgi:hypothetical protein